ncbi:conserved hypothetical protein [Herpetosiphon aurantiacus DSM 785]|uniref:Threonine dehydratase n=1 Tax=Herpetosiphon aurantiacus (strain ATCC 23779 / DSM 785 / 114-95) TaxID=316274 RepID=A9AW62_HERA2|nr:conserved hypothetical protein [Herpetosiphon aurantiacus DSM 785]
MDHQIHEPHAHIHSAHCGHTRIHHDDHIDYVHNGHLHAEHEGHYDDHVIAISATNPAACAPVACACTHDDCGHEMIPHGDHVDYLYEGRLHHRHGDHCDDHGPVTVVSA